METTTMTGLPVKTIKWEYWGFGGSHEWRAMWRDRSLVVISLKVNEGGSWYELSCPNLATAEGYQTLFHSLATAKCYAEGMIDRCGAKRLT